LYILICFCTIYPKFPEEHKLCPYNFLIKEASRQPSCAVGLFLNDKSVIKNKCEPIVKQFQIFSPLARVFSFLIASPMKLGHKYVKEFYLKPLKRVLYCGCTLQSHHFIILPHLHQCREHTDVIMAHKPNLPLLLHSESLILEEYNSSKELQ
jgi:hypothetical protein